MELKELLDQESFEENRNLKITESIKSQIVDRLLQPGVSTKQILNFYI